jgi:hypothetical protein
MTSSTLELTVPKICSVTVTHSTLTFEAEDGRAVSAPLDWFPRLKAGSDEERGRWMLIGAGYGVHWPDLDEDISIESLLAGKRSLEGEKSFQSWLDRRVNRSEPHT